MTAPKRLANPPPPKPLARITPSRFASLGDCALRETWSANGADKLLPVNPKARLGTVAHRLLEAATKGRLQGASPRLAAEDLWDALVSAMEQTMLGSWLDRPFVPLRQSVNDYEVRRLRACNLAATVSATTPSTAGEGASPNRGSTEVWVEAFGGKVGGFIDQVVQTPLGTIIRDYKTGTVLEREDETNAGDVRRIYQDQLRLYAALYHHTFGTWPVSLEVVPLQGTPVAVEFDPQECEALLVDAVRALEAVNDRVTSAANAGGDLSCLATPSPDACSYCPYRPICTPYWQQRHAHAALAWPHDCRGTVASLHQLGSGMRVLVLNTETGPATIRLKQPGQLRHPALEGCEPGTSVSVFSLRPTSSPTVFEGSAATVVYQGVVQP